MRLTVGRFILLAIPFFLILFWMFNIVMATTEELCVCHVEKHETGKGHVIEVDEVSLEGHLKHGDVQCTVDCEKVLGKTCHISSKGECK